MDKNQLEALLEKWASGRLTEAEQAGLQAWYDQLEADQAMGADGPTAYLSDPGSEDARVRTRQSLLALKVRLDIDAVPLYEEAPIYEDAPFYREGRTGAQRWRRRLLQVAASVIGICLAGVVYFALVRKTSPGLGLRSSFIPVREVQPGSRAAILVLAGGKTIVLDSVGSGSLATQGNTEIRKQRDGEIVYAATDAERGVKVGADGKAKSMKAGAGVEAGAKKEGMEAGEKVKNYDRTLYNTLSVPRGSKVVHLTLADGSQVWLNAASSLRYPAVFAGRERRVEITGEAYFEVTHDPGRPFFVSKGNTTVQVLGTHFNINAYDDESRMRVTLLEGAVKVRTPSSAELLQPGQQAELGAEGRMGIRKGVDTAAVMAWKNGLFRFDELTLPDIMRQISRWYDVDVVYAGKAPDRSFGGGIDRNLSLTRVLGALEKNQVRFRVEGRTITVLP